MSTKQINTGFTLMELMVVIVIIGVLAAVAIPKFREACGVDDTQYYNGPIIQCTGSCPAHCQ